MHPDFIFVFLFALFITAIVAAYEAMKRKYCCKECHGWWKSVVLHDAVPGGDILRIGNPVYEHYKKRVCKCGCIMSQRRWTSHDPDES